MLISAVNVERLSIAHWDAVNELFATSPGANGCWCMWPRRPRGTHTTDSNANRTAMKELLDSGHSPGLVALTGQIAVGWCAFGPRNSCPQYERSIDRAVHWAVPCLYVCRAADRQSIARALIAAAVDLASENGAVALDGPPPYWLPGNAAVIAAATDTFLENGFARVGPGARMPELRRILIPDG